MRKETIGDCILYLGDCRDIMPTLSKIDAIITDPPYSSGGTFRSDRTRSTGSKYIGGGYVDVEAAYARPEFSGDNKDQRAFLVWSEWWMRDAFSVCRDGAIICVFTDWRQLPTTSDALQISGWTWRGIFPWDKTEAARPQRGWFRNQCEYVLWGSSGVIPTIGECHPGLFRKSVGSEGKEHIAGKPISLMETLIKITPPNSTILDPFMGSASTGIACLKLGRKFIGIELEPKYFDISCKRIEEALKQGRMEI